MYEFSGMRRWIESRTESVGERRRGQIGDKSHRGGKILITVRSSYVYSSFKGVFIPVGLDMCVGPAPYL